MQKSNQQAVGDPPHLLPQERQTLISARCGSMKGRRIAYLRRRFGLTLAQAAIVAVLYFGGDET